MRTHRLPLTAPPECLPVPSVASPNTPYPHKAHPFCRVRILVYCIRLFLIEARLPIAPYAAEWQAVGEGKNPKLYKPFSDIEMWIPRIFMLAYFAAGAYGVVMLILQGTQGATSTS